MLQKYEKEFTELTGITVGSEQVPEQQQRQKAAIEFASGATSFDALMLALHVQKRLAAKGGWLADLKPLLADPTMTAPDFDFQDFSEAGRIWATQADGKIDTFPINIDYHLVYYNKDLFQAAGLAFPQTYDEMLQAAKALTDPGKGRFGWVSRGLKNANVVVWTNLLLGWDVDSIDQNGADAHRRPARGRGGAALHRAQRQVRPARARRLQLDGEPGQLHAGPGRHVAGRDRLRAAARGPEEVADRRQGRLRHHAEGAEGPALRHVRRRHGGLGLLEEAGPGLLLRPVGDQQADAGADAGDRQRRAAPQLGLPGPGGAAADHGLARVRPGRGRVREDRRGRACRSSSR